MRAPSAPAARWAAATCLAALAGGCGEPPNLDVPFRVVLAPGLDPAQGADEVCTALEAADGEALAQSCSPLGPGGLTVPSLGRLAFGVGLRVRVETVVRDATGRARVVARGRSFPIDVGPEGVIGATDVLLGRVGAFAQVVAAPPWVSPPVFVAPTPTGALVATSDGAIWRYEPHPEGGGGPRVVRAATSPERAGAAYAAFDDGAVLAVGGAEVGATSFGPDGRVVAILEDASLEEHRLGATVVVAPGAGHAFVYGGTDAPDAEPFLSVTRIVRLEGGGLRATIEDPLSFPRRGARAALLTDVGDQAQPDPVALLVGGSAPAPGGDLGAAQVVVVDPVANVPRPRYATLDRPVAEEAGVGVLARDLALVVGGRAQDGESGRDVRVLEVEEVGTGVRVNDLVGAPRDVFDVPRRRPAVVSFGDGLALVVGGITPSEAAVAEADVVYVDRFSIEVEPTSDAPVPLPAPTGTALADGTVLVVDPTTVVVWFPARER